MNMDVVYEEILVEEVSEDDFVITDMTSKIDEPVQELREEFLKIFYLIFH